MAYVDDRGKRTAPSRPSHRARKPPAPKPRYQEPPHGDIASSGGDYGTRKAKGYSSKAAFRKSVRQAYVAQPLPQRKAVSHAAASRPGPAARAISHEHTSRVARNRELEAATQRSTGTGIERAQKYLAAHPEILHPQYDRQGYPKSDSRGVPLGRLLGAAIKLGGVAGDKATELGLVGPGLGLQNAAKDAVGVTGLAKHGGTVDRTTAKLQTLGPSLPLADISKAVGGVAKTASDFLSQANPTHSVIAGSPNKILSNIEKDAIDIPAEAIPSTYRLGELAATGHTAEAAKMVIQPYVDTIKHPVKSFEEHPLGTLLLASGMEAPIGKLAGKGMRAIPGPTRRLASTGREAKTFANTSLRNEQAYSQDPLKKAGQKAVERLRGGTQTVLKPHEVKRRVDETFAADEDIRRTELQQAREHVRQTIGKEPSPAVVLGVQNIANDLHSLQAYRAKVAEQQAKLRVKKKSVDGAHKLAANKETLAFVDQAIRDFKADPEAITHAIESYKNLSVAQQTKLGALYGQSDRLEMRRLQPYAVTHMGGHMEGGNFVDAAGRKLTPDAIRSHMADPGTGPGAVSEPGFISHAPGQRSRSSFYVPTHKPASIGPGGTTGTAVTEGTFSLDPKVLEENAAKSQGLITTAQRFGKFIEEFAQRDEKGNLSTFSNWRDAHQRALDWNVEHPDQQLRPVRINPIGDHAQLSELIDRANSGEVTREAALKSMSDALEATGGEGPFALIPDAAAERAVQHMQRQTVGEFQNIGNLVGSSFRRTVLPLSPKWMTGNVVEAALRSLIAGVHPGDYYLGHKALKALEAQDPRAALEARARIVPGGQAGIQRRHAIYTDAERFAGTRFAGLAQRLGKVWRTPGPKGVANFWHAYTDLVFNTLNGKMEGATQTAMLGRELRRSPLMSGHLVRVSKAAIDDAAKGLRDTNAQVQFGRAVDRMYGRYSKMSPSSRRIVATTTPFIPWFLNAVHFTYKVLPQDHPVLTSLVASAHIATEDWLKDKSLSQFMTGGLPNFLQGTIPLKDGSHLNVTRYTPFGAFTDVTGTAANEVFPVLGGTLDAFEGRDWKGKKLKTEGTPAQLQGRLITAANSLIEATIPGIAIAERAAQRKDMSVGERANAEFNPIRPIPPGKSASSDGGKKKYFDSTGSKSTGKNKYFDTGSKSSSKKKKYFN